MQSSLCGMSTQKEVKSGFISNNWVTLIIDFGKLVTNLADGLNKENMIAEDDKILLNKIYLKIKKEFENLDKSKI